MSYSFYVCVLMCTRVGPFIVYSTFIGFVLWGRSVCHMLQACVPYVTGKGVRSDVCWRSIWYTVPSGFMASVLCLWAVFK